nr:S24 family peptidase [uncultured Sphingomonas sp.]
MSAAPDILRERIEERIAALGTTAREISVAALGQPDAIRNIIKKGAMPGAARLDAIAAQLGTTSDYLLGRTAAPSAPHAEDDQRVLSIARRLNAASPSEQEAVANFLTGKSSEDDLAARRSLEDMDLVGVASVDMAYGMGLTFAADPVDVEVLQFPRRWLESLTSTAPQELAWARGRGNSMSPTIEDNDLVLIDRSDRSVRDQDAIWAFTIGEVAMMKRLRVRGEQVTILSDNTHVPPDHAHPEEIHIVGRVSHIVRRL